MKNTVLTGMSKAIKITEDPDNGTKQVRLNTNWFQKQGVVLKDGYYNDPVVLEIYNEDSRDIILD
jgi:hypothetical protein